MPSSRRRLIVTLAALGLLSAPRQAAAVDGAPFNVYMLTNPPSAGNAVVALRVSTTGAVSPIAGSPFLTGGTGMAMVAGSDYSHRIAVSAATARLFAANELEGSIAVFNINRQTGALTSVPGSPFVVSGWAGFAGMSLTVSGDGQFLYGSSVTVASFKVASNGGLTEVGARWAFSSRTNGSVVSEANDYLYLAMSDRVTALKVGPSGLTGFPPTTLNLGTTPTDVVLNHAGSTLYVGTRGGIQAFYTSGGTFTPVAGTPFFPTSQNLSGLSIDTYDRLLIGYGQTGPQLSASLLVSGGALQPGPASPFPPALAPTGAALSPDGRRLFLSNHASQLDAWNVDEVGGLSHVPGYPSTLGVSSGFSKLVTFPSAEGAQAPALPWGAGLLLAAGLIFSAAATRRRSRTSPCSQSSGN